MNAGSLNRAWPTILGGLALVVGMGVINEDVRRYFSTLWSGGGSAAFTAITWRARDAGWLVVQAVKDQSIEHGPLMIFVIAASVLLLFMLRT